MSNYKDLVNSLTTWFEQHPLVNEVTFGDEGEVDVTSITDFPLAHITPSKVKPLRGHSFYMFDIYILSTKEATEDPIEVLGDMAEIAEDFVATSPFFDLIDDKDLPESSVVYDQFSNRLYGIKFEQVAMFKRVNKSVC